MFLGAWHGCHSGGWGLRAQGRTARNFLFAWPSLRQVHLVFLILTPVPSLKIDSAHQAAPERLLGYAPCFPLQGYFHPESRMSRLAWPASSPLPITAVQSLSYIGLHRAPGRRQGQRGEGPTAPMGKPSPLRHQHSGPSRLHVQGNVQQCSFFLP